MFYTFWQNNSGGSFCENKRTGIATFVIIEARDADHANERAEKIGLYFDGVNSGVDCPCCGDRWDKVGERDGTEQPTIYGKLVGYQRKNGGKVFIPRGPSKDNTFIHFLDKEPEKIAKVAKEVKEVKKAESEESRAQETVQKSEVEKEIPIDFSTLSLEMKEFLDYLQ